MALSHGVVPVCDGAQTQRRYLRILKLVMHFGLGGDAKHACLSLALFRLRLPYIQESIAEVNQ
jgi:hypothetical protein